MTCVKQIVVAVLVKKNKFWIGTNSCDNPQKKCPRKKGEGYEKCKSICKQKYHAEIDVCKKAGKEGKNGKLYLIGHNRICSKCKKCLDKHNIKKIKIINEKLI